MKTIFKQNCRVTVERVATPWCTLHLYPSSTDWFSVAREKQSVPKSNTDRRNSESVFIKCHHPILMNESTIANVKGASQDLC